jgi:hypothetical protein
MAMKEKDDPQNLFRRLTRLFKSGPVVRRKVRGFDTSIAVADKTKSSGVLLFQKSMAPSFSTITSNAYNLSERLMRYNDYNEMCLTPEIASALDIYADETCAQDDHGRILHIYSDNEKVRETLEGLFYDTLNVEFNLRSWTRNLVMNGDIFIYNDVHPKFGVVSAFPIPVNEIEREENYDREDPFAVRFRWVTLGNRTLENWEVSHFRLLGQDTYLPYGASLIEAARKVWRQLILLEDAMLVYRVVRAPERRVFYIDVGNTPPSDVDEYMEAQRRTLRSSQVVDKATGRVDLRYAPLSIEEDYFLPIRGGDTGTKIDTLSGGQNAAAIEDVAYMQKKLIAALKIPRAYLGYDDMLSSKASLAQLDIRFSRTINVIQKTIIAELNKLAIIHLYAHGFRDDDLMDFTLRMSNPSTVAQQQKLELWRSKFEIGGTLPEGMGSRRFVQREVWGLNDKEIEDINNERLDEAVLDATVESGGEPGEGTDGGGGGGGGGGGAEADLFGGGEGGEGTGEGGGTEEKGGEKEATPPEENAGEEPEVEPEQELLTSVDDPEDDEDFVARVRELDTPGARIQPQLKRALYNKSRRRTHGASSTSMPDLNKMTLGTEAGDETDDEWRSGLVSNPLGEARMTADLRSQLRRMEVSKKFIDVIATEKNVSGTKVLTEGTDVQDEIDALDIDIDFLQEDAGGGLVATLNERLARESELSHNDVEHDDE